MTDRLVPHHRADRLLPAAWWHLLPRQVRRLLGRVVLGRHGGVHPELHRHWTADVTMLVLGLTLVCLSVTALLLLGGGLR